MVISPHDESPLGLGLGQHLINLEPVNDHHPDYDILLRP